MLNIYSDEQYLPIAKDGRQSRKIVGMLYPFWNRLNKKNKVTNDFINQGKNFLNFKNALGNADVAVLPSYWKEYEALNDTQKGFAFIEQARKHGIRVFVFDNADNPKPLPLSLYDNVLIFRTSFYRSKKKDNEFSLPAFKNPSFNFSYREKRAKPVVGFCGRAIWNLEYELKALKKTVKEIVKEARLPGSYEFAYDKLRLNCLNRLKRSSLIDTNFVIRNKFYGGAKAKKVWTNKKQLLEQEYFENLEESDFALTIRGKGNFSFRFYEALAAGRIPIFVNTDCPLPFDDFIRYTNFFSWVEPHQINSIDQKVLKFYQEMSKDDFANLQKECYNLWKNYLTMPGFFSKIHWYL